MKANADSEKINKFCFQARLEKTTHGVGFGIKAGTAQKISPPMLQIKQNIM